MPGTTTAAPLSVAHFPRESERSARLRRYLNAYWLRPENALWMTLRSLALLEVELSEPALDLGCGDGLFSFLHAGGELDSDFDVFRSVAHLDRVTRGHADMFDHFDPGYAPRVLRRPARMIDTGADLKPALLRKAETLGLYRNLIEHDSEAPQPFPDAAFATVYCNCAYWIRDLDGLLEELARIVRPRGRVVLQVKLADMAGYTLAAFREHLGAAFLDIIGRGRLACWPSLLSRGEWERRFRAAGLAIVSAAPIATRTHAEVWDVGLRPVAPLLVRMAGGLSPQAGSEITREWVELMFAVGQPLCRHDFDPTTRGGEPAEV